MSKNLTITIVGVAIASIGLIFVLTSSQGTESQKMDCADVYREYMIVRQKKCLEMFGGDEETFNECNLEAMSSFNITFCDLGDK